MTSSTDRVCSDARGPSPLQRSEVQIQGGRKAARPKAVLPRLFPKKDLAGGCVSEEYASCPTHPPPNSLKAQVSILASFHCCQVLGRYRRVPFNLRENFHFAELNLCLNLLAPYFISNTYRFNPGGTKTGTWKWLRGASQTRQI